MPMIYFHVCPRVSSRALFSARKGVASKLTAETDMAAVERWSIMIKGTSRNDCKGYSMQCRKLCGL